MTFGGAPPGPQYYGPLPRRRAIPPWWFVIAALVVLAGIAVPVVAGHTHRESSGYRVGDCVVVSPSTGGELRATKTSCDTDPSFTVAKLADPAGNCPSYDQFRPPAADAATGNLCLVPNLVVGHCYRFGISVGLWDIRDCADAGPTVLRVAKRLDADDAQACRGDYLPARTYPSPPRTYCLATT